MGAGLGVVTGSVIGLSIPAAVIGGANGLVSGHRRIYDWTSATGVAAFVLDSTWSLLNTAGSVVCHGAAALQRDSGFDAGLSERCNRHVYARGLRVRRGFATTIGNVVNGAGDLTKPRRRRLVTDHEAVHVRQARGFGPLFFVLYGGWMVTGAVVGTVRWLAIRRKAPLSRTVDTYSYYLNPFEWWAYSRDANWPPRGKLPGVGWRRPVVSSYASCRAVGHAR